MTPDSDQMIALLGKAEHDPALRSFLETLGSIPPMERNAYYGFLEYPNHGISLAFKEATWVFPGRTDLPPDSLYLAAIHFYRRGEDGYCQFSGHLPNDVNFGDSRLNVLSKVQGDGTEGGGGQSTLIGPIPRWLRYDCGSYWSHFEFDEEDTVRLVTVMLPDAGLASSQP